MNLLHNLSEVELIGVVDSNQDTLLNISNKYDLKGYSDYGKILRKVEAVVIAVPTVFHYEIAKTFIQAGKHVLVEKPLTNEPENGRELLELAKKKRSYPAGRTH